MRNIIEVLALFGNNNFDLLALFHPIINIFFDAFMAIFDSHKEHAVIQLNLTLRTIGDRTVFPSSDLIPFTGSCDRYFDPKPPQDRFQFLGLNLYEFCDVAVIKDADIL